MQVSEMTTALEEVYAIGEQCLYACGILGLKQKIVAMAHEEDLFVSDEVRRTPEKRRTTQPR